MGSRVKKVIYYEVNLPLLQTKKGNFLEELLSKMILKFAKLAVVTFL